MSKFEVGDRAMVPDGWDRGAPLMRRLNPGEFALDGSFLMSGYIGTIVKMELWYAFLRLDEGWDCWISTNFVVHPVEYYIGSLFVG